jgi:hypothetical protein
MIILFMLRSKTEKKKSFSAPSGPQCSYFVLICDAFECVIYIFSRGSNPTRINHKVLHTNG